MGKYLVEFSYSFAENFYEILIKYFTKVRKQNKENFAKKSHEFVACDTTCVVYKCKRYN